LDRLNLLAALQGINDLMGQVLVRVMFDTSVLQEEIEFEVEPRKFATHVNAGKTPMDQ
jgi:hypothetical protein